jgi:glycosyltransferase involved in cell wall biosynthesis
MKKPGVESGFFTFPALDMPSKPSRLPRHSGMSTTFQREPVRSQDEGLIWAQPASRSASKAIEPRVALITDDELMGHRWNGRDLMLSLRDRDIAANLFVQTKHSTDPDVKAIAAFKARGRMNQWLAAAEARFSLQSVLFPWSAWIGRQASFRKANIVHLHLFHTEFLGLPWLPSLVGDKKLLITLHDAWPATGHCAHPAGCAKYQTGCGACPDLASPFAMRVDRTALMMRIKRRAYLKAHAHLHVTTDEMARIVKTSQATAGLPYSKIPLGVATQRFKPGDVGRARQVLGVQHTSQLVIGLHATSEPGGGLQQAVEALRKLAQHVPITVLAFHKSDELQTLQSHMQVIKHHDSHHETALIQAYQAMDVFLMPSTRESFGFEALEAMACGVPPVVFEGTAMHELLGDARCGYLVPRDNAEALADTLLDACRDRLDRCWRSGQARARACRDYSRQRYEDEMVDLYRRLLSP